MNEQTMVDLFRSLGASNPEAWAHSEATEPIAQLARFCFLRRVWQDAIEPWRDRDTFYPIPGLSDRVDGLIASGCDPEALSSLAATIAYHVSFAILMAIDDGTDPDEALPLPGWRLVETDQNGQYTGRTLNLLHESLIETDPSGQQARDVLG